MGCVKGKMKTGRSYVIMYCSGTCLDGMKICANSRHSCCWTMACVESKREMVQTME